MGGLFQASPVPILGVKYVGEALCVSEHVKVKMLAACFTGQQRGVPCR